MLCRHTTWEGFKDEHYLQRGQQRGAFGRVQQRQHLRRPGQVRGQRRGAPVLAPLPLRCAAAAHDRQHAREEKLRLRTYQKSMRFYDLCLFHNCSRFKCSACEHFYSQVIFTVSQNAHMQDRVWVPQTCSTS